MIRNKNMIRKSIRKNNSNQLMKKKVFSQQKLSPLFRLYLAYTDLILVFKVDLIAFSITSQLVYAGANPFKYLLYYGIITFLIHLPSMVYQAKTK